jgi:membrane protein
VSVSRREVLRGLPRSTVTALRGHDVLLYGAGVTFYAAIALVPGLLIAARLLSAMLGRDAVLRFANSLSQALPSALGADRVGRAVIELGAGIGWTAVLVSLLPATVYGEGLRRAYVALTGLPDRLVGWRGRLAILPVLVVAPALLLAVLAVTPLISNLFGEGLGGRVLGVYVALNVDWLVVSVPLSWTFRVVAPTAMPWRTCLVGGFTVGAFISGFLQGFVLFLSLPIDLGAPFGGQKALGGAVAVLLWLWLLHLVVLVGWVATLQAHRARQGAVPATS